MNKKETGFAPLDWAVNIGSMAPAFGVAVGSELINSGVDVINYIFGTDFDLSFKHNHLIN